MIREVIMHTEETDIPEGYVYDTETSDFYVYRHKYTGDEIHKSKNPPLYVNIQPYINEVLDKIKVEIGWRNSAAYMGEYNVGLRDALKIIDKYTADMRGGKE